MIESKLIAYIGFAIKSGKVIFGYDNVFACKKTPKLIIYDRTLGQKVENKLNLFAESKKIEILTLEKFILSDIIKKDNCKVLGICDENLANVIAEQIKLCNKESSEVNIGK